MLAQAGERHQRDGREKALRDFRGTLILEAAERVFAEHGFDKTTMRAIAVEAGCTTGAIYPIFESKEGIYGALLTASLARLQTHVAEVTHGLQGLEKLSEGARAFVDYYAERPAEVALGLHLYNGLAPRGLSRELDRSLNKQLASTLAILTDGVADGGRMGSGAAQTEMTALFAFLIGALMLHHTGRLRTMRRSLDQITALYIESLAHRLSIGRGSGWSNHD